MKSLFNCLCCVVGVSDVLDSALLEDGSGLLLPEARRKHNQIRFIRGIYLISSRYPSHLPKTLAPCMHANFPYLCMNDCE